MNHRLQFAARQLLRMLLLLVCVSAAAFALLTLSPVDPLQANVGQAALGAMSPEQIERLEAYWGVNDPTVARYLAWAGDFVRGDMGVSLIYRRPVSAVLGEKLAASVWLMGTAWALSGVLGLALGVIAGVNRGRWPDRIIRSWSLLVASTPAFWLGLVLLMVFSVWLNLFPVGFSVPIGVPASAVTLADRVRHGILPALTLSITGISSITLHTREKMIDIMQSDHVLFARARGEGTCSIVLRHGLRGILLPAITLQFAQVSEIFGGSVLVEQVFSWPGLGQAAVDAGLQGDAPLLLGITVISAAIVFLGNVCANLLYGAVDPRIRRRAGREVAL